MADCQSLPQGLAPDDRLALMLGSALAEAMQGSEPLPVGPSLHLLLVPSELPPGAVEALGARFAEFIGEWPAAETRVLVGGNAAAWQALEAAYRALEQNPRLACVQIAAVDSLCLPARLHAQAQQELLLQPGNAEGYVPGEAAACVVLVPVRDVSALPPDAFALHRPGVVQQSGAWWPSDASPNAQPVQSALQQALDRAGFGPQHISHLISDMDGSSWRGQLETAALDRVGLRGAGALPHWYPAHRLGQLGTPTGLLQWILPVAAHAGQAALLNSVMSFALDRQGLAAACVLERSPQ